jgi:hypothetical protein
MPGRSHLHRSEFLHQQRRKLLHQSGKICLTQRVLNSGQIASADSDITVDDDFLINNSSRAADPTIIMSDLRIAVRVKGSRPLLFCQHAARLSEEVFVGVSCKFQVA